MHRRLTCARLYCGIRGIRFNEQYQFLFQILLGIRWLSRDSATTASDTNRNNSMQSPRTLKSQQVFFTALALGDSFNAVKMLVRLLTWSLTGTRRIFRSSPMNEAYMLSDVVEQGLRTRAVVFDMKGQLNIHQTIGLPALTQFSWDNYDVRELLSLGLATTSEYLSKKRTSQRIGNTSSTKIFDTRPIEKKPLSKKRTRSAADRGKEQERPEDLDA